MRCLTLATRFSISEWSCAFFVGSETVNLVPALAGTGFEIAEQARENDREALIKQWPEGADLLVVDNYSLDSSFETTCRGWAKKILVIDDLANRLHDCNYLLDATPGRTVSDYQNLVPENCRLLLGPEYALLRDDFVRLRDSVLARREEKSEVTRILVSFGLTDSTGATLKAVEGILKCNKNFFVDIILGRNAPDYKRVARLIRDKKRIKLHDYVANMPTMMAQADLMLGAAGTTSWERCCLGLPGIVMTVADNQEDNASNLADAGAIINLGRVNDVDPSNITISVSALVHDYAKRFLMGRAASTLCDGLGSRRATQEIADNEPLIDGKKVRLRLVKAEDINTIYRWQSDPRIRRFFRNSQPPSWEEHRRWFNDRRSQPVGPFNIVTYGEMPVGVLRLDRVNGQMRYEVSIYIAPKYWCRRIGHAALSIAADLLPEAEFFAYVHPNNTTSHRLFINSGYIQQKDGMYVLKPREVLNG